MVRQDKPATFAETESGCIKFKKVRKYMLRLSFSFRVCTVQAFCLCHRFDLFEPEYASKTSGYRVQ